MSKYRTAYAPEFRQQLIELVHARRSANDVAKEFGLHATTVAKWVRLELLILLHFFHLHTIVE